MASIPRLGARRERLTAIEGQPPDLSRLPAGCAFAPRCPFAEDRCRREAPAYEEKQPGHWAACWRSDALYGAADA